MSCGNATKAKHNSAIKTDLKFPKKWPILCGNFFIELISNNNGSKMIIPFDGRVIRMSP